jgi:hypothetical protein
VVIDDELDLMLRYGESDKIAAELGAVRTEAARGHAHYTIDCAKRGSVPSLRIELEDARDVQKNLVLELDEYIINEALC